VRHLPVVDDGGKLVGMISDRDVRDAVFAPAFAERLSSVARRRLRGLTETVENLRVKDVMTWDAVTTDPDAQLAQAAAVMFEGRFGSLPVMEQGKLVGIVTERDVLKALAQTLAPVRGIDPDTYLW
jgi:acetoin utilization protein AcuB